MYVGMFQSSIFSLKIRDHHETQQVRIFQWRTLRHSTKKMESGFVLTFRVLVSLMWTPPYQGDDFALNTFWFSNFVTRISHQRREICPAKILLRL